MIGEFIGRIKFFLEAHPEKKGLLVTLLLLIALPVTILAALTVQNIRQRAAQSDVVKFTDSSGIPLPDKVSDPNVYLWINLPNDWKAEEPSSKNPLVQEIYAQPACRAETTTCGQPTYGKCTFRCSGGRAFYDCVQTDNVNCQGTIECPAQDKQCQQALPTPTPTPTPTRAPIPTQAPPASCQTRCDYCARRDTCGVQTYDTCVDDKGQSNLAGNLCENGASKFRCYASLNNNCISDVSGGFNYSCSACPASASPTFSLPTVPQQPSPTQTPSGETPIPTQAPTIHILKSLTIENKDSDGLNDGAHPFTETVNFQAILNRPFRWKLNGLKDDQQEAARIVQVKLSDGSNIFFYAATITLTRPTSAINPTPETATTPTISPPREPLPPFTPSAKCPSPPERENFIVKPYLVYPKDKPIIPQYEPAVQNLLVELQSWYCEKVGVTFPIKPLQVVVVQYDYLTMRCGPGMKQECITNLKKSENWGYHINTGIHNGSEKWDEQTATLVFSAGGGGYAGANFIPNYTGWSIVGDYVLEPASGIPNEWGVPCRLSDGWQCARERAKGTIAHELGHAFGLPHPGTLSSVMEDVGGYPKVGFLPNEVKYLRQSPFFSLSKSPTLSKEARLQAVREPLFPGAYPVHTHPPSSQAPISPTPSPTITLPSGYAQDATYDLILKCFGQSVASNPSCREADLNGDGVVDIFDYNKYVEDFGKKASP